ncbi:hypothetical protein ACX80W_15845 [Arthrobacter sp. TMN-37]
MDEAFLLFPRQHIEPGRLIDTLNPAKLLRERGILTGSPSD